MGALLAELNTQQVLANGLIGGGAGLLIAVVASLLKKPTPNPEAAAAGKKPTRPLSPLLALILVSVSLALIVLGIMWRVTAQNP